MQFLDSTTAGKDKLLEFKFHVDWSNPANSTFGNGTPSGNGKPIEIPVADFDSSLCNGGKDAPLHAAEGQLPDDSSIRSPTG